APPRGEPGVPRPRARPPRLHPAALPARGEELSHHRARLHGRPPPLGRARRGVEPPARGAWPPRARPPPRRRPLARVRDTSDGTLFACPSRAAGVSIS